jgi:hypothetical protein
MEIPFKGFRTLNNVDQSFGKPLTDLDLAANIDFDDRHDLRRRGGITKLNSTATHSAFATDEMALFRQATSLYRMKEDFSGGVAIKAGLTTDARMGYVAVPPARVFMCDGVFAGWTDGSDVHTWGIARPTAQPVAAGTSGSLPAGRYQFAVTFIREDGEESGTPRAGVIELTAKGGIAFSSIPVSSDPDVSQKAIYLTRPGGKDLQRALRIANAATTATYRGAALDLSVRLETLLMGPPGLLGSILGWHHGRALMGAGAFLQFSKTWRPELFHQDDFKAFTSSVRFVAPVTGGVWVGTAAEVAFLRGEDIRDSSYELKAKGAAIRDSVAYVNGSLVGDKFPGVVPIFATENGVHAGTEDGQLVPITQDYYRIASAFRAAAINRTLGDSTDGTYNQYLAVLR